MAAKLPRIWADWLYDGAEQALHIRLESAAWWAWLAAPTTRSFSYPVYDQAQGYIDGFMTVRKERRQRGGSYWVAYRRGPDRLHKRYLGAPERLTKACLDRLAQSFLAAADHPGRTDEHDEDDSN